MSKKMSNPLPSLDIEYPKPPPSPPPWREYSTTEWERRIVRRFNRAMAKATINIFAKPRRKTMNEYKKHIDLLGYRGTDKITGFEGVIDSVSFDLYGCVQVTLKPPIDKDGAIPAGSWFDVTRIQIHRVAGRVVDTPNFDAGYVAEGKKGAADKPACRA